MNDSVIISGAGPVGLVLALLLHRQGKNVDIFEAVSQLAPLGVGINLLPHSVRVLHELDLESELGIRKWMSANFLRPLILGNLIG